MNSPMPPLHRYSVGERVFWNDPDKGLASGTGKVTNTQYEDEDEVLEDAVISLKMDDGGGTGALACELEKTTELTYGPVDKESECSIKVPNGRLVSPSFPTDCDYIRIVNDEGYEVVYWHYNEFEEDPKLVLGALMGVLCELEGDGAVPIHARVFDTPYLSPVRVRDYLLWQDNHHNRTVYDLVFAGGLTHLVAGAIIMLVALGLDDRSTPAIVGVIAYEVMGLVMCYWASRGIKRFPHVIKPINPLKPGEQP